MISTTRIIRRAQTAPEGFLTDLHPILQRIYLARQVATREELEKSLDRLISPARRKGIDEASILLADARLNTTRSVVTETGHAYEAANRRIFYDFTISPPKSVSVAALIGGDAPIVEAHHRAVETAVASLERFAATRVHVGNSITDRVTGNMVCAVFRHDTSRALDPHLHSHCVVFNATHDPVENRWKALQNHHMLRARKYVESVYYHELSRDLHRLGYTVIDKPRGDFEIEGVTTEIGG